VNATFSDTSAAALVRKLTKRESVAGYIAPDAIVMPDTWVVASWVGVYGQYLRWGFFDKFMSDWSIIRLKDNSRVWQYRNDDLRDKVLSLSVFEGVAIVCLSRDPLAAGRCRLRLVADTPTVAPLSQYIPSPPWPEQRVGTDQFWARSPAIGWTIRGSLTECSAARITGFVEDRAANAIPTNTLDTSLLNDLESLLGDSPDSLLVTTWQHLTAVLETTQQPSVDAVLTQIEELAGPTAPVFAALLNDEYSGRIMRLRVPAVMIGVKLSNTNDITAEIDSILDSLNAEFGTGLIPKRSQSAGHTITTIDTSRSNGLALIAQEERPAIASIHQWLLLASNARVLERMLARPNTQINPTATVPWLRALLADNAGAIAWSRTAPTADALTKAKAVATLGLMLGGGGGHGNLRTKLDKAQRWIDIFGALGECSLCLSHDAQSAMLFWEITPPRNQ
jgi:hypothetical protein